MRSFSERRLKSICKSVQARSSLFCAGDSSKAKDAICASRKSSDLAVDAHADLSLCYLPML